MLKTTMLWMMVAVAAMPSSAVSQTPDTSSAENARRESIAQYLGALAMAENNLGAVYYAVAGYDSARAHIQNALQIAPGFAAGHLMLGLVHFAQGKRTEALRAFKASAEDDTAGQRRMDMVPPDTVHTWAREQFSRMMRTAPNLSSAHTALALLYSQGGYAVDAEHHYLQAIKNDSTYVDAHTGLGKLYTDTGRFDEAAPVYEKVLALSVTAENRPRVYLNLGVSYMGAGRRTDAIYAWRKALEMAPDYAEAYMNLGIAYQQDGHPDSARSVWTQALNIKPDFIAPRVALARLYSAENRLDEALRYYREVLDAGARDPTLFAELGLVYERLERFQEAIINYEEASRLDPEDTDLQTALKAVQNKLTEQEEARKASKIRIRQIVVRVKAEAERILADLKNGADFVEMARSRSIDPSAARGGDLGYFGPGEMIPAFEEATRVMKVGDISGVVETPIGYHIIKRVE